MSLSVSVNGGCECVEPAHLGVAAALEVSVSVNGECEYEREW